MIFLNKVMIKYKDQTSYRLKLVENYLTLLQLPQSIKRYYKSKKILITGGAGAIGSNLAYALSNLVGKNGLIIILDNLSATINRSSWNVPNLKNIMFIKGDVRNDEMLRRVFQEKPSIVFHLAAFFANQNSVDFPEKSAQVDIIGTNKLLQLSSLTAVNRFIYASSGCAIYGSSPKLPVSEDFISMYLTTPYQINKMAGEMYCNYYNHQFGLKTVNCRFFNSYGPGEIPGQYRNVIPNFIYWATKKQSLPITGNGAETRDFTNVLDLTQGLIKAGFYDEAIGQNFNLAAGKEITIKDVASLVNKATGNTASNQFIPSRIWDTKKRMLASITKAKKLINYKPIMNFQEGFAANIKWFKMFEQEVLSQADFKPGMSSAVRRK